MWLVSNVTLILGGTTAEATRGAMRSLAMIAVAAVISGCYALAPCDDKFIAALANIPECYKGGKPPAMMDPKGAAGAVVTTLWITKDDLPPDVKCLTGRQDEQNTFVDEFWNNGSITTIPYMNEVKEGYTIETDEKGQRFRMYTVHNEESCLSYYICIDGTSGGTGTAMMSILVDCKKAKNAATLAVVDKAVTCFEKQGLKDKMAELQPCDC